MYAVKIKGPGDDGIAVVESSISLAAAMSRALESWEANGDRVPVALQIISEHFNVDILPTGEGLAFLSWPRDDAGGEG